VTLPLYSIDTHALYWYETAAPMLSPTARGVFDEADRGKALLVLNPIVLAELYYVLRKAGLDANFAA
jgi:predicted nucleic acid-binding protein